MTKMSSVFSSPFFAQAAAPQAAGPSGMTLFLVYGLFIAGFYFLLIAPQRKKQKQHEKMLAALQTGDEIITSGGIYGVITNVKDDRFVVRIGENTKIEIAKGFVQTVLNKTAATDKK